MIYVTEMRVYRLEHMNPTNQYFSESDDIQWGGGGGGNEQSSYSGQHNLYACFLKKEIWFWFNEESLTWSKPLSGMDLIIREVSNPKPVKKPAHSKATSTIIFD